jgi:hypothetical protein
MPSGTPPPVGNLAVALFALDHSDRLSDVMSEQAQSVGRGALGEPRSIA